MNRDPGAEETTTNHPTTNLNFQGSAASLERLVKDRQRRVRSKALLTQAFLTCDITLQLNDVQVTFSVTRLGDSLDFGQLFKGFGNNYFAKSDTFLGNFGDGVKIFDFSNEIIFGQLL